MNTACGQERAARQLFRTVVPAIVPAVLLLAISGCVSAPREPSPPRAIAPALPGEEGGRTNAPIVVGEQTVLVDKLPEIVSYGSSTGFTAKVDWMHDALFVTVQRTVGNVDGRFVPDAATKERVPVSRFRLGVYAEITEEADEVVRDETEDGERGGTRFGFDPDFEIDIQIPNIERRLSLFVTTEELGELPGTDATERDQGAGLWVSVQDHRQYRNGCNPDAPGPASHQVPCAQEVGLFRPCAAADFP